MIGEMVRGVREMVIAMLFMLLSKASTALKPATWARPSHNRHCLSWRLAVETNNLPPWRTVPAHCLRYVETYMTDGQYQQDLKFIVDQIMSYVDGIRLSGDGMDAWLLDVDDTCISNLQYYRGKRYGCDPYDPVAFRRWAVRGGSPGIEAVVELFRKVVESGLKVFLVTGRDEDTLGEATAHNLHREGFLGYHRLILRRTAYKGQSAVEFKTAVRRKLVEQGYRIWGNVGDQWSDLHGQFVGDRTFKLPNPMYFVP